MQDSFAKTVLQTGQILSKIELAVDHVTRVIVQESVQMTELGLVGVGRIRQGDALTPISLPTDITTSVLISRKRFPLPLQLFPGGIPLAQMIRESLLLKLRSRHDSVVAFCFH